jgi:two-component system NtrC family sensor kinase
LKICSISPAANRRSKDAIRIHDLIDEVLVFLQHHSGGGAMIIEKVFAADLPQLTIDEKKIKQVFINLLMNAQHANGNRGTLRIVTRHDVRAGQDCPCGGRGVRHRGR